MAAGVKPLDHHPHGAVSRHVRAVNIGGRCKNSGINPPFVPDPLGQTDKIQPQGAAPPAKRDEAGLGLPALGPGIITRIVSGFRSQLPQRDASGSPFDRQNRHNPVQ